MSPGVALSVLPAPVIEAATGLRAVRFAVVSLWIEDRPAEQGLPERTGRTAVWSVAIRPPAAQWSYRDSHPINLGASAVA